MILNALLFVLIGIELLVIEFKPYCWLISLLPIGLVLAARYLAVWLPYHLTRRWLTLDQNAPLMMTWGGLRGGIFAALALSISNEVPHKGLVVAITYAVVLFLCHRPGTYAGAPYPPPLPTRRRGHAAGRSQALIAA